jgi:hypothetical protein
MNYKAMHGTNARGLRDEEQLNVVTQKGQDLKSNTIRINVCATKVQQEKIYDRSVRRTSARTIKAQQ